MKSKIAKINEELLKLYSVFAGKDITEKSIKKEMDNYTVEEPFAHGHSISGKKVQNKTVDIKEYYKLQV